MDFHEIWHRRHLLKIINPEKIQIWLQSDKFAQHFKSLSHSEMALGFYDSCGGINMKKLFLVNNNTQENNWSYIHGNMFNILLWWQWQVGRHQKGTLLSFNGNNIQVNNNKNNSSETWLQ